MGGLDWLGKFEGGQEIIAEDIIVGTSDFLVIYENQIGGGLAAGEECCCANNCSCNGLLRSAGVLGGGAEAECCTEKTISQKHA